MSVPTPDRRRLGGDRVVALLVVMLSLPTIAWLVATDDPAPAPATEAAGATADAPETTAVAAGAAAAMPMHDDSDHEPMHPEMHDDTDHEPMHPEMHDRMHDGATPSDDATSDTATTPAETGSTTVVRMDEFSFDMPLTYTAGTITFEVINEGVAPHEFALGAVGDHHSHLGQTEWMDGGTTALLTVDLEPGTYEVGCHVPGHYEAGMKATITVTG